MKKRRLKSVGHAIRHENTSLMSTVLIMGKIKGKRKQGRPAENLQLKQIGSEVITRYNKAAESVMLSCMAPPLTGAMVTCDK